MTAYIFEHWWPKGESPTMTVLVQRSIHRYNDAADFMQDMSCKGQQMGRQSLGKQSFLLTEMRVLPIRKQYIQGNWTLRCFTCYQRALTFFKQVQTFSRSNGKLSFIYGTLIWMILKVVCQGNWACCLVFEMFHLSPIKAFSSEFEKKEVQSRSLSFTVPWSI